MLPVEWFPLDSVGMVALLYPDNTYLLVRMDDWNRAFGCILSSPKDFVQRDFAVYVLPNGGAE